MVFITEPLIRQRSGVSIFQRLAAISTTISLAVCVFLSLAWVFLPSHDRFVVVRRTDGTLRSLCFALAGDGLWISKLYSFAVPIEGAITDMKRRDGTAIDTLPQSLHNRVAKGRFGGADWWRDLELKKVLVIDPILVKCTGLRTTIRVPMGYPVLLTAAGPVVRAFWRERRSRQRGRRAYEGRCPECGYFTRPTGSRCPECGHESASHGQ